MGDQRPPVDTETLRKRLSDHFLATDLRWSLFVAALYSYRFDTVLKPFPPQYIKNGEKDMKNLVRYSNMKVNEHYLVSFITFVSQKTFCKP